MKILRNKFIRVLAILAVLGIAFIALHPFWLPPVASLLTQRFGVSWESVQPRGWTSFEISNLEYSGDGVTLRIDQAVIPQPVPWVLDRIGLGNKVKAAADTIEVTLGPPPEKAQRDPPGIAILGKIQDQINSYLPWLPEISIQTFNLNRPDETPLFTLEKISLSGRLLSADFSAHPVAPNTHFQAWLGDSFVHVTALTQADPEPLQANVRINLQLPDPEAKAVLLSNGSPLMTDLQFSGDNWLPEKILVEGEDWPVPRLFLPPGVPEQSGFLVDVHLEAQGLNYQGSLSVRSPSPLPKTDPENLTADIQLKGNDREVQILRLDIQSAWLVANLTSPVTIRFEDRAFFGDAEFSLEANLEDQPWIPAAGKLAARARLRPGESEFPDVVYSAEAKELFVLEFPIQSAQVEGYLRHPVLVVEAADLNLGQDSRVNATSRINLRTMEFEGEGQFSLGPEWLQNKQDFARILSPLSGKVSASGVYPDFQHEGSIEGFKVERPGLHPVELAFDWTGAGINSMDWSTSLASEQNARAKASGSIETSGTGETAIVIESLDLIRDEDQLLGLDRPFSISIRSGQAIPLDSVSPFEFSGPAGKIGGEFSIQDPLLRIHADNFALHQLDGWTLGSLPKIAIHELDASITGLDPFLAAEIKVCLSSTDPDLDSIQLQVQGIADANAIRLDYVDGEVSGVPFASGSLHLPVRVNPSGKSFRERFVAADKGKLEGSLKVELTEALIEDFQQVPYLETLRGTHIDVFLQGTLDSPEARITASLETLGVLHLVDERLRDFNLESLNFSANLNRDALEIEALDAKIEDAFIELHGIVDAKPLFDWIGGAVLEPKQFLETSDLVVSLDNFRASSFSELLPGFLRPTGRMTGDLRIEPGPRVTGSLRLLNFSLRPSLYTQPIDGISLSLEVENTRMTLASARANVGNSTVNLSGYLDFGDLENPLYSLKAIGKKTPIVRTPDLLLHADVDLSLDRTKADRPANLQGTLEIRDSILLMEIDPLAARTAGREMPNPPFFSIGSEPFSQWEIDVDISGQDGLRFKSPYAKALLSTQLSLSGTLGNPILVGSIYTSEGDLEFPGTSLFLSRSEFFVTRNRQNTLQLNLNGTGQVASYIITMHVGGSAEEPHVEFASTPSLSNAQIFHLLATGSLTSSDVSSVGLYLGKGIFAPGSGKGLFDRLSVEVGRDVTETGKNTIDLYYDLTRGIRFHGQYDKYEEQNLDLEWEVFSR